MATSLRSVSGHCWILSQLSFCFVWVIDSSSVKWLNKQTTNRKYFSENGQVQTKPFLFGSKIWPGWLKNFVTNTF